jgi:hypothetical protein
MRLAELHKCRVHAIRLERRRGAHHLGIDRAGTHGEDADVVYGGVERHLAWQRQYTGFAGAIRRDAALRRADAARWRC